MHKLRLMTSTMHVWHYHLHRHCLFFHLADFEITRSLENNDITDSAHTFYHACVLLETLPKVPDVKTKENS